MSTPDEMMADARARVIDSHKRDFVETTALAMLAADGAVDQTALNARVAAEWVAPSDKDVTNRITAKFAAAVDFHEREAVAADEKIRGAKAKVERIEADLAAAKETVSGLEAGDERAAAEAAKADAQAAYEAAQAAGGVAAPPGSSASARADVAGVVGEAMSGR